LPGSPLHVLAIEPWLGGSHARFLEAWRERSAHRVDVLGLPARHWRWRMEGGALTLAERAAAAGPPPDVLWVSDYVDLARLRGFLPPAWRAVPALAYFHENQLTFPRSNAPEAHDRAGAEDLSLGFTNVLTAVAAEQVVFNSRFHLEDFAAAAVELVRRLPRPRPAAALEAALASALVIHPGIERGAIPLGAGPGDGEPLRLVWCHRWEHDKGPLEFLEVVRAALGRGAALELVLLGRTYERTGPELLAMLDGLEAHTRHRGYAEDQGQYLELLGGCDAAVSTARHEFYGISSLEAAAAGCAVLAPRRLAYPETLTDALATGLYDSAEALLERLVALAAEPERGDDLRRARREATRGHDTARTARQLDAACEALAGG